MSVTLYDEALAKKLKNICERTSIHVYNVSDTRRLFEVIADETKDKNITLPIICLRRNDGYQLKERGNNPRSANGPLIGGSDKIGLVLNQMPIQINYQIDVYARQLEEADTIMRELIFILTNSPSVIITIPYEGINYEHKSALTLSDTVRDNSAISERLITGQFTRLSIDCNIPDAYMFDVRKRQYIELVTDSDFDGYSNGLNIVSPDTSVVTEELPVYKLIVEDIED